MKTRSNKGQVCNSINTQEKKINNDKNKSTERKKKKIKQHHKERRKKTEPFRDRRAQIEGEEESEDLFQVVAMLSLVVELLRPSLSLIVIFLLKASAPVLLSSLLSLFCTYICLLLIFVGCECLMDCGPTNLV